MSAIRRHTGQRPQTMVARTTGGAAHQRAVRRRRVSVDEGDEQRQYGRAADAAAPPIRCLVARHNQQEQQGAESRGSADGEKVRGSFAEEGGRGRRRRGGGEGRGAVHVTGASRGAVHGSREGADEHGCRGASHVVCHVSAL